MPRPSRLNRGGSGPQTSRARTGSCGTVLSSPVASLSFGVSVAVDRGRIAIGAAGSSRQADRTAPQARAMRAGAQPTSREVMLREPATGSSLK